MKNRIEAAVKRVSKALAAYNFDDPRAYAFWLSQAYYFVDHSTPMLALSAGLAGANKEYHNRCIVHLSEEKGHDKMLLNDLKAMGYKAHDFPELAQTQALYQTQYYWIEHKSPVSFLGYIMLLEGLAVEGGKQLHARIQSHKGKSFIRVHSEDDEDHLEKAMKMMAAFSVAEQELIVQNCELSAELYLSMMSAITAELLPSLKSA